MKGKNPYTAKNLVKNNAKVAYLVDGIIPTNYTYKLAYSKFPNLSPIIPLPINTDEIKPRSEYRMGERIRIMHGISRRGFKGSGLILKAMEIIGTKYPEQVECIVINKLPLDEYIVKLHEVDIVIDQAFSYEYAMNALYAMASGKVVLSGNEPEVQNSLGVNNIPVINILPNVDDIVEKLEVYIENPGLIIEDGKKSRMFVEKEHNYKIIAEKYISVWETRK
jgi:glycosyltransferase involved in cell wall biosynthesis